MILSEKELKQTIKRAIMSCQGGNLFWREHDDKMMIMLICWMELRKHKDGMKERNG